MISRIYKLPKNNSFFVFGARGTGKSTWLLEHFKSIKHSAINLLDPDQEALYSRDPGALSRHIQSLEKDTKWVFIDEVQKVPKLLDVVHNSIENDKMFFALTGSSARKLKRGSANMLAGRAFVFHLYPFTHKELGSRFSLQDVLEWGSLPKIFEFDNATDKARFLKSYTQTYLKEEILVEQIVRKLEPFRHFLEIAAQQNGEIVNFSNIARDVGVDTVTCQSYFQILEDTLIGHLLPSYHRSIRKRQRVNPKFYLFDIGVKRAFDGTTGQNLIPGTYSYGKTFEHFIILEALRLNDYYEKNYRLSYLRTKDDAEIDLIIERPGLKTVFIEIKSSHHVDERDVFTLKSFKKDMGSTIEAFCFSNDSLSQKVENIWMLPWEKGFKEIGLEP